MTLEEERDLLLRIRENPHEFGLLFDLHYKNIFGYLFRRTADYDLARDLAAETFLKAYLNIGRFESRDISVASWLYRIATNEFNSHLRKLPFLPLSLNSLSDQGLDVADPSGFPEEREALERELESHRDYHIIQARLKDLPLRYQEVIALRYFENKTLKEMSEILQKPDGTVKSLLFRGIEKLRKELETQRNRKPGVIRVRRS